MITYIPKRHTHRDLQRRRPWRHVSRRRDVHSVVGVELAQREACAEALRPRRTPEPGQSEDDAHELWESLRDKVYSRAAVEARTLEVVGALGPRRVNGGRVREVVRLAGAGLLGLDTSTQREDIR